VKKLIAKILFISDPHYSVNSEKSEEKWFPPICDFLEKMGWKKLLTGFLKFWDTVTQRAFEQVAKEAKKLGPYSLAIGLGDYTPGANEKGMLTKKARIQYSLFANILNGIRCPKKLIWGDHDVGYHFDVEEKTGVKIGTEGGGVSAESVQIATKLVGPPFGSFSIEGMRFIFIATNLIRNIDKSSDAQLRKLKLEQENFLAETLHNNTGKFFLLLHDPTVLTQETAIRKIIDSHRKKIAGIIHGHLHAEFSRWLAKFSPTYRGLNKKYKTILVPASWGMLGIGGGFLVMNVHDDGTYEIERHKV